MSGSELLVIGGASGVGKSSAAFALHDLLAAQGIQHAVVEGDALDLAYPAPWKTGLAFKNLAAIWANYKALGHHRLIFTNTVSVLEVVAITKAMGDDPRVRAVLLQSTPRTLHDRLRTREHGDTLDAHAAKSRDAAVRLDVGAESAVHRLDTEGRTPHEIAQQMSALLGWTE